jgi:tetratricopeptide (TPR) repeat protein
MSHQSPGKKAHPKTRIRLTLGKSVAVERKRIAGQAGGRKGENMKRVSLLLSVLVILAGLAVAQQQPAPGQAAQAPATQAATPAPAQTAQPAKAPPQAKSQDEYKAFNDASQLQDPAALEAAANAFADKYKTSELRYLLYYRGLFAYQAQNNAEKAIEMGRKVLSLNPDEPVTLAMVASMISERTRETDLDRDERLTEAMQDAQRSLAKVDTDLLVPPGTPPERVDQNKKMVRSAAYAAIGNIYLAKNNYPEAEKSLKQSIDMSADNPDAITLLRYAISLDQQKKYGDALMAANKALDLSPPGSPQSNMAKQERERLLKLSSAPAPTPATTPATATPAPAAPPQKPAPPK